MEKTMGSKIHLHSSGIPIIDKVWGGLYKGATYVLIGSQNSGRTLLALQFAKHCVLQGQVCLYFTSMRHTELFIHAATIDFDMQHYMNKNLIVVIKVSDPFLTGSERTYDEVLADYMSDIAVVVKEHNADKVVFDDFTQFVGFNNMQLLEKSFINTIESIEAKDKTSLFLLSDPVSDDARSITSTIVENSTGVIYLEKRYGEENKGIITITPIVGHPEGKVKAKYYLKPYEGISIEIQKGPVSSKYNVDNDMAASFSNLNTFESNNPNIDIDDDYDSERIN
ncbi:MAG: hypothetical protein CO128_10145 [Ignavibacteriales bacterium CG_4_9_14_3_um_filter_30_11]|nr:MAG: hypothetical protein CO128_10145 [Ignavibacteriales bacterium CG_4_9_14_3_um_filter_30_11]